MWRYWIRFHYIHRRSNNAPVAQWRSKGLIIPWLQVRVLPGAPIVPSHPTVSYRSIWRSWCSGSTAGCGSASLGSTPSDRPRYIRVPNERHLPLIRNACIIYVSVAKWFKATDCKSVIGGSNPPADSIGRLAQMGGHSPHTGEVAGSSPAPTTREMPP